MLSGRQPAATHFRTCLMKPSHDLTNLIAFSQREGPWPDLFRAVLDEHFGPALEEFDLDFEDLE